MLHKPFLKIIAGIENRDLSQIMNLVEAAVFCKVSAIDICDSPEIIKSISQVVKNSSTKLFVSSLNWQKLAKATEADYLEYGNYDHLYAQGHKIDPAQILEAATKLVEAGHKNLSITIPGYLSPNQQASLANNLLELGVSILQTEGGSIAKAETSGAIGQIEKAKVTLANTLELKTACPSAFIMAAGGLTASTAPLAIACGASAIGIGQSISKLPSKLEMVAAIKLVQNKLSSQAADLAETH